MSAKIIGASVRLWTYRAQGIAPAGLPPDPGFLERAIRSSVCWNDGILSWLRGTDVQEQVISEAEADKLMAQFRDKLAGY